MRNYYHAEENDINKCIGYNKVVDGVLKESKGEITEYSYIKSETEVVDENKLNQILKDGVKK